MERNGSVQAWLETAGAQIRWRRARRALLRELEDHIADQARDFEALGDGAGAAAERAVAEMGDPTEVGKELDRLHRPRTNWSLLIAVLAVLGLGIAAMTLCLDGEYLLRRQLVAMGVGLAAMAALWGADYSFFLRRLWLWGAPLLAFCVLTLCFPLWRGAVTPGRLSAFLGRGTFYVYLFLPLLYTALVCRLRGRGRLTAALASLLIVPLALLPMSRPDFSTALICGASMLAVLTAAAWAGWFQGGRTACLACAWGPVLGTAAAVLLRYGQYLGSRLTPIFRPEADPLGKGWQALLVRGALERMPLLGGTALTQTEAQFFHPQGWSNGFDLLWLAARWGTWVLLAAGMLLAVLALWVALRVRKLKSGTGKLLCWACTSILLVQGAGYLSTNLGWRLFGAEAFPLLTYGPGYLLADLVLVGIVLSVFRMDALVRDGAAERRTKAAMPGEVIIPLPFDRGKIRIERLK